MTQENITQLKQDFETFEKISLKKSNMYSVIDHLGKVGRNDQVGVYQNSYNCQIQVALQYTEGGTNYWKNADLDKEFAKTISNNFESLMSQTIERVNLEYENAKASFDKYEVKNKEYSPSQHYVYRS